MAASNSPQKSSLQSLLQLTDAELDEFIQSRSVEDGYRNIEVADPENDTLLQKFAQRLRDRTRQSPYTVSQPPIDLDEVNSRLLAYLSTSHDSPIPAPPLSSTISTQPPSPAEGSEIRYYHRLQDDGGRPLYPIEQVAEIRENPDAFRQMLQPWARRGQPDWHIFEHQFCDWMQFRRWQIENRNRGRSLADYTHLVQQVLTRYEVTSSFTLLNEPQHQDELTTWVEYLAYTCNTYPDPNHLSQHKARIEWILQLLSDLTKIFRSPKSKKTGDHQRSRRTGIKNTAPIDDITTDQFPAPSITQSKMNVLPKGKRTRDDGLDEQQPRKRRAGIKNTSTINKITIDQFSSPPVTRSKLKALAENQRTKDDRPTPRRSRRIAGISPEFTGIA